MLKLEPLLDRKPSQLSGGQRQRVAIGRAIVRTPEVFLFDEPLSNLDAALRVGTRAEIAKLHRELGATMIYVTHDQVEAMTLANRIVVLEAGYVRQFGPPMELYHRPQNQFVAGFIGSPKMNFISVEVLASSAKSVTVKSSSFAKLAVAVNGSGISAGQKMVLGVRPEHVGAADKKSALCAGRVDIVERLGHESYIEVKLSGSDNISALLDGTTEMAVGDEIALKFDGSNCHLFNADGIALQRLM